MTSNITLEYIQSLRQSKTLGPEVTAYKRLDSHACNSKPIGDDMPRNLRDMLYRLGIDQLYSHQSEAIGAIRQGRHVVVGTPTASGKSLIYNTVLFDAFIDKPDVRALYVFPLKALTRDQLKNFRGWSMAYGDPAPSAEVYDGDTSDYRRRKIRRNPPNVVMTNPEMLHLALMPHHQKWAAFFRRLELVVIDEMHTYRGLLGSHMAQVIRRLHRICRFYSACPTYVMASATIGNPKSMAEQLTGLDFHAVENSGAKRGAQHVVMMNPSDGPAQTAIQLLKASLSRKLRTIVYTQSRKMAELISFWAQRNSGRFAKQISVYRAGLLPEERRRIEAALKSGELLAVVSTSALELGIDIGDLDLCILVGYPGSITTSLQRSGRVGRKGQPSAVVMLAGQDALDQYFIDNPNAFFLGRPETAVVNPYNQVVLASHLECAAAELPLASDEPWLVEKTSAKSVGELEDSGRLLRSADGRYLHARRKRPHLEVNLRAAGRRFRLVSGENVVGEVNDFRLYRETHPGAIYLHQGEIYRVNRVDMDAGCVTIEPAQVDYYTRIRAESDVDIVDIDDHIYIDNIKCCIGNIKVTDQVTGFVKFHTRSGRALDQVGLDVPPSIFATESIWFEIDAETCDKVMSAHNDLVGALHAAEHALIGIMPLVVLADRNDIGGLTTPFHRQTGGAAIFIYDGIPGGAGLSRSAFRQCERLLDQAGAVMDRCECHDGCPSCVHSPKCGSGNHPIDKSGAKDLIRHILQGTASSSRSSSKAEDSSHVAPIVAPGKTNLRYGVFDLETQRSAAEVGGWHRAHLMKVSCGVVYDSKFDNYTIYLEKNVSQLIDHLSRFDSVIGFNTKRFDYKVLSGYNDFNFDTLPSIDLLELIHRRLGFRLSLDHLAENTLNVHKSGTGLDALRWWQKGEIDKIIAYCRKDVQITKDLFLFARDNGYLIYRQKSGDRFRIPIRMDAFSKNHMSSNS